MGHHPVAAVQQVTGSAVSTGGLAPMTWFIIYGAVLVGGFLLYRHVKKK